MLISFAPLFSHMQIVGFLMRRGYKLLVQNLVNFAVSENGEELEYENDDMDPNAGRFVRYQFTPQFLKLKTVGAT